MLRSFATSPTGPARWYLIDDGSVAPDVLDTLLEFARGCGIQAESLTMPDALVAGFDGCGPYPRIAWYRAVLADLLVQEDRVVYLDSDVLVLHDLGALWGTELGGGHLFGAVAHPSYAAGRDECAPLGLAPDSPIFHSG